MTQKFLALIVGKLSYLFAFVIVNLNLMKRSPEDYFFRSQAIYVFSKNIYEIKPFLVTDIGYKTVFAKVSFTQCVVIVNAPTRMAPNSWLMLHREWFPTFSWTRPGYSETGPCAPYFFRLMVTLSIVPVNLLLARV